MLEWGIRGIRQAKQGGLLLFQISSFSLPLVFILFQGHLHKHGRCMHLSTRSHRARCRCLPACGEFAGLFGCLSACHTAPSPGVWFSFITAAIAGLTHTCHLSGCSFLWKGSLGLLDRTCRWVLDLGPSCELALGHLPIAVLGACCTYFEPIRVP